MLAHFVLAMMLNPSIQRKAQEELDRVVGPHRLPVPEDEPDLPYLTAILREVMRFVACHEPLILVTECI